MEFRGTRLGDILLGLGVVQSHELHCALGIQRNWGHPLGQAFISLGILNEQTVVRALSLQLGTPSIRLGGIHLSPNVLEEVPFDMAMKYRVLPLDTGQHGGADALYVAMSRPWDLEATDSLSFITGMRTVPVLAGDEDLAAAIGRLYQDVPIQ